MKNAHDRHTLDAASLAATLSAADPDLPVRLLRWHAEQLRTGGPTADGGTAERVLSESRRRTGFVACRDDAGKKWAAFDVCILDGAVEVWLRSDVGRFELVADRIRWK